MSNTNRSAWNMLDSYKEGQAIYGRDDEISRILDSVHDNVQTFIYGKSGIGKTSLIQAGVFPELRKMHFFPVVIRLAFYHEGTLSSVVKELVQNEASRVDETIGKKELFFSSLDGQDLDGCPLFEYFSKMCFENSDGELYIPVLVFDQFEETINNEENWQRTVDFLKNELYDLMDNSVSLRGQGLNYTNYRILFSIREDYLYCLEDIIDRLSFWELRYNRFRIHALDDDKAAEVIRRTCGATGLEYNEADHIVDTVIKLSKLGNGSRFTEVNTAVLSMICSLVSANSEDGCIYYSNLRNVNSYMSSYYDDICRKVGRKAVKYLESHLLTKDGRRSSIDEDEALYSGKIDKSQLDYLVKERLIRAVKMNSTSIRYEYIHDLFARMVFRRKKGRALTEYKFISQSIDFGEFLQKSFLSVCAGGMCLLLCWLYSKLNHSTFNMVPVLIYSGGIVAYLIFPLLVQRFHSLGRSGWNILLIPLSIILLFGKYESILPCCLGILVWTVFVFLFSFETKNKNFRGKLSCEYENMVNGADVSNGRCAKWLIIELLSWCGFIIVCNSLSLFYDGTPLSSYGWSFEHCRIHLIPVILLLTLTFSHAIRARLKTIGINPAWSFAGVILLPLVLLPDRAVKFMRLYRRGHGTVQNDDVFAELKYEFDNSTQTRMSRKQRSAAVSLLLKTLIFPFFEFYLLFNGKTKYGDRMSALVIGLCKSYLEIVMLFLLASNWPESIERILDSVVGEFVLGSLLLEFFLDFIMVLLFRAKLNKKILNVIEQHPKYSNSEIAEYLALTHDFINKRISMLESRGLIYLQEEFGTVVRKVNRRK